jgi:hypothetical protein
MSRPNFLFNRKSVDRSKIVNAPIIAAGDKVPDGDTIHAFDSEDSFKDWLQSIGLKDNYNQIKKQNSDMQKYEFNANHFELEHQQRTMIDNLRKSVAESSSLLNIPAIYEHADFGGGGCTT